MLVIGEKEMAANAVAVRSRKEGDKGAISVDEFIEHITREIRERTLNI
jgi:threonyl-tRNA synthetase